MLETITNATDQGTKSVVNLANSNMNSSIEFTNAGLIQWIVIILILSLIGIILLLINRLGKLEKAITELAKTTNDNKEYTQKDFDYISKLCAENSILRIDRRTGLMVDRNSIEKNIDQIKQDLEIVVDRETEVGRDYLRIGGFKDYMLNFFFGKTDKMKVSAKSNLKNYFEIASKDLSEISKEKEEFILNAVESNFSIRDLLLEYDKFYISEKNIYTILKKEIWQICEKTIYNTQKI